MSAPSRTGTVARIALLAIWLVALIAIGMSSSSDGAMVAALALSLLCGVVVGRWWALAAAPVAGLALLVMSGALSSPPPDLSAAGWLYVTGLYVLLVDVPLALGIGLNRVVAMTGRS